MDLFLGKLTQHAMNYAIRSGIAVTSTYALKQCSRLLKTVDNSAEYGELQSLQERLSSKIKIISPAIDMIELISARGNTSLESAITLTKQLRWDIQALGTRITKAASAEEASRNGNTQAKTQVAHKLELQHIMADIRGLLLRIEDSVPLINLAITTSGAKLSTTLPSAVSPSRLLQASTFLTTGDNQFLMDPNAAVQVGPTQNLSMYMLFTGHRRDHANYSGSHREAENDDGLRDTTWKEVIHKARVRLMRVPLQMAYQPSTNPSSPASKGTRKESLVPGEMKSNEFAYQIEIIEDLEDERVHTFEDGDAQPGPFNGVRLAGMREMIPVHQIAKIFYADTGKILDIGRDGEPNSPVLLLKRDVNAVPPRRAMAAEEERYGWNEGSEEDSNDGGQANIDEQLRRESSVPVPDEAPSVKLPTHISSEEQKTWQLPPDLDPEWLAFEMYAESEEESSEGEDLNDDSAYESQRPSLSRKASVGPTLTDRLSNIRLSSETDIHSPPSHHNQLANAGPQSVYASTKPSFFGTIRSSLSLLEVLIRLMSLQQFTQTSHLAVHDELLSFFLDDSSTTGGSGEERHRKRWEARQKVGFDPYSDSPVKAYSSDHQYREQAGGYQYDDLHARYSRGGTPYDEYDGRTSWPPGRPRRDRSTTPLDSSEGWAYPSRELSSPTFKQMPRTPTSPISPYQGGRNGPVDRVRREGVTPKTNSPLGRGRSVDTDSSLGTSPATPKLKSSEQ